MERMAHRTGTAFLSIVDPILEYERTIVDAVAVTGDALSGPKSEENEKALRKMSRQFTSLGYTATEVAEGIGYMGMAGMGTNQILGSMAPTLNLAKAASLDLARTTDLSTDIMTAFSLKMGSVEEANKSMTRVADVMTKTFTGSNTTLSLASQSLFKVGNLAVQAGLSLETTAGAVGMLASAGIKGSESGTAIRNMLLRLTNPTKMVRDSFQMLRLDIDDVTDAIARDDLPRALKMLDEAMSRKKLNEAKRLKVFGTVFGTRAASSGAFLTSMAATGDLGKKIHENRMAGKGGTLTATVADKKMQSDAAKVAVMKAELQQMGIDLGTKVLPGLMPVARALMDMAKSAAEFVEQHPEFVTGMAKMLASMAALGMLTGPATTSIGALTRGIGILVSMRNATQSSMTGIATAIGGTTGTGGLAGAAAASAPRVARLTSLLGNAGLVAAAVGAGVALGSFIDEMTGLSNKLSGQGSRTDDDVSAPWWQRLFNDDGSQNLLQNYSGTGKALAAFRGSARYTADESLVVKQAKDTLKVLRDEIGKVAAEQSRISPSEVGSERDRALTKRRKELREKIEFEQGVINNIENKAFARTRAEDKSRIENRDDIKAAMQRLNEQRVSTMGFTARMQDARSRHRKMSLTEEEAREVAEIRKSMKGTSRRDAIAILGKRKEAEYETSSVALMNAVSAMGLGLNEKAFTSEAELKKELERVTVDISVQDDRMSVKTNVGGKEKTVSVSAGQLLSMVNQ